MAAWTGSAAFKCGLKVSGTELLQYVPYCFSTPSILETSNVTFRSDTRAARRLLPGGSNCNLKSCVGQPIMSAVGISHQNKTNSSPTVATPTLKYVVNLRAECVRGR